MRLGSNRDYAPISDIVSAADYDITALNEDRDGILWMAINTAGAMKLTRDITSCTHTAPLWSCHMFDRLLARTVMTSALFGVAACSGDKATAPEDPSAVPTAAAVGSYTLVQVNGTNVPYTFFSDGFDLEITSGTLVLRADRSFTETHMYADDPLPNVVNGTFSVVGSVITFTIPAVAISPGFISNGLVTHTFNGLVFQYQRQ